MATTEWYMSMAVAMGQRAHALNMVKRWQDKVDAAETQIQELSNSAEAPDQTTPGEQVQE